MINFRVAVQDDRVEVGKLQQRVLPNYTYVNYANNIARSDCLNIVGCLDGNIVAFATTLMKIVNPNGATVWERLAPYIGFMGVEPSLQRSGIGSALMGAIIERVQKDSSAEWLYLECERGLCDWYARFGFKLEDPADLQQRMGLWSESPVMRLTVSQ